jgi:hypothetical protein
MTELFSLLDAQKMVKDSLPGLSLNRLADRLPDSANFPAQANPKGFLNPSADFLAQIFEILRRSLSGINHKIGVFFGHLCAADHKTSAADFID